MRKHLFHNYDIDSDGFVINNKTNKVIDFPIHKMNGIRQSILRESPSKRKHCSLHVLIAQSFIDDFQETDLITFIDGDKKNCSLSNLSIRKDYYILDKPDTESLRLFESLDIERMCKASLAVFYGTGHNLYFNGSFGYDDAIQEMMLHVYSRLPYYQKREMKKHTPVSLELFINTTLKQFLSSKIYRVVNKNRSVIQTQFTSADFEIMSLCTINNVEAYQLGIFQPIEK